MMPFNRVKIALLVGALAFGCSSAKKKITDVQDKCEGLSFEDVQKQDGISESCRLAINDLLPTAHISLHGRLFVLGSQRSAQGTTLFVAGTTSQGSALGMADFSAVKVKVTDTSGSSSDLSASEISVKALSSVANSGLIAASFVTDYSASMSLSDLQSVADIHKQILTCLPPVVEAQVSVFSTTVTVKQDFTSSFEGLLPALALDSTYVRASTALFDGVGQAVEALGKRPEPVRVLVFATDGRENASKIHTSKEQVSALVAAKNVFVLALGSLFADEATLKSLSGARGAFVYARSLTAVSSQAALACDAFKGAVQIALPNQSSPTATYTLQVAGREAVIAP